MLKFASGFIIFKNGKIGLQLRDTKSEIQLSGMVASFGGHMEDGETPIEAFTREIKEELNLDVEKYKCWLLNEYHYNQQNSNQQATAFHYILENVDFNDIKVGEGFLCAIDLADDLEFLNLAKITKLQLQDYFKSLS